MTLFYSPDKSERPQLTCPIVVLSWLVILKNLIENDDEFQKKGTFHPSLCQSYTKNCPSACFLDQNHIQIRPKNVNFSQKVMQIIGFYSQG